MDKSMIRRCIIRILSAFVVVANLNLISSSTKISYAQPITKEVFATQQPFTLSGVVKDQSGNPIPGAIYVTDRQNNPLASLQTDDQGVYSATIPTREATVVNAFLQGIPQNLLILPDGYQVLKFFELTKGLLPDSDNEEVDFVLPPAAALQLEAYDPAGSLMNFDAVSNALNSTGFYGYDNMYGVFPLSEMALPVPAEASIGQFRWAWPPEDDRSLWEPYFKVPVSEPVFIMMLWEVPGVGTFPLRADNQGLGYTLSEGGARKINLVYEFAETEHRRTLELKSRLESSGHTFSPGLLDVLSQADAALTQARGQGDEQARALTSYTVLKLSIQAKEQMTMEAAGADIPKRKNDLKIVVQDPAGKPVPGTSVSYQQKDFDFVLSFSMGAPFSSLPYPSYRAGLDIGYQSLYGLVVWSQVSPQEGVFDFSATDAAFKQWKEMGYDVTAALVWLGDGNIPSWAQNLSFAEFQQQMGLFVKKAVEHYNGVVKHMNVATEINMHTVTGSRYISVAYPSDYLLYVQPSELIALISTAFQEARAANANMLLGYYGIVDYNYSTNNPLPWGGWPASYTFLKSVLESGVRPDYIGMEAYPEAGGVPLDLSTVAAILQAYHDLSGLPVFVAETVSLSTKTEDYSDPGPAPQIYWHDGFTEAAQAEWETSFDKIAMSLPFMVGIQMFHGFPDYPSIAKGTIGWASDVMTNDFVPKKSFAAVQDLIASWKANGSGVTDAGGEVSFSGMGGTYSIGVTTPDGLFQDFELELNQASNVVTVTVDAHKALGDLWQRWSQAQKEIDWSAQLGRSLDYTQLRSRLGQARSAISTIDYAGARSLIDQVLNATAITIDGSAADWQGIPPILTAAPGGVQVNAPGIDLKAMYGMLDDQYLYLLVEVYDPPIILQPGQDNGGISFPGFTFDLTMGSGAEYAFGTYLPYRGQIDLFRVSDPFHFIGTYYSIAYHNALELKIPLALIGNPYQVSACGFVSALENGAGKVAKAFDGCAWVLHPAPTIFLPLIKR